MVYDGEQIAYEQQLRLDGANNQTGTAVISYASILCALPELDLCAEQVPLPLQ